MRLNEDLVEAIALGHDLGHTPFGHAGEQALDEIHPGGFAHYRQSIRVVQILEKNGEGLNLTWEVRDGILNHRISGNPLHWKDRWSVCLTRLLISIMIWMMRREQALLQKMIYRSHFGCFWDIRRESG